MFDNQTSSKTEQAQKIAYDQVTLSIIVPVYNEEIVLPEFHRRITSVLDKNNINAELIYVNDGSKDGTKSIILALRKNDPRVSLIDLSRNFGKEIALTAGLNYSKGSAVVVIDADLQDPPELIPELMRGWQEGYDVVYAKRTSREGESFLKKASSYLFFRIVKTLNQVDIPVDTGDFRLLSRRAVDALNLLPENHRFMKGLFAWIGFPQIAIEYKRDPRFAGDTKWSYWELWDFALEGITSFTIAPLKIASYIGLTVASGSFVYAIWIFYKTLVFGDPVSGFPTLIIIILFLGGLQLMTLGIIGEYLGRMFNESKRRPLYFVQDYYVSNIQDTKIRKGNDIQSHHMSGFEKQRLKSWRRHTAVTNYSR
jgi:polyisoprenyl-phosphate glycosyltransferase